MREQDWAVVDTMPDGKLPEPGDRLPVLGRFDTQEEGSAFIETLPDYETGRYGLDGPPED